MSRMSNLFKYFKYLVTQIPDIVTTYAYLYFIFIPIRYLLNLCLGRFGVPSNVVYWFCIICVTVLVILGQIHTYRWYQRYYEIETQCSKCGNTIMASYAPTQKNELWVDPFWQWHVLQSIYQRQMRRPRLHYICPDCGYDEYICPYCHKPVGKDDKKCPNCRKNVYHVADGFIRML